MNDVARLVLEAWEKLGPGILGDSYELNRRLARRRLKTMTRPVRAWCLALRASDRRITAARWVLSPEHALDLYHPHHPYEPIEHEVTIRTDALRRFCRPVRTDSWGELVDEVAAKLGVHRTTLQPARWAGIFTERIVRGLGGKKGINVPLIHSWTTLDPGGTRFFLRPDALWGALWEFLPDMIPDDFEQSITRRPTYRPFPIQGAPREYWEKRQRGWQWVCPGCRKEVRVVFYPLPPQTLFNLLGADPGKADIDTLEAPPPTFACTKCHEIQSFSRIGPGAWNQLVTHLTRGLLYGHEVNKPAWYREERKRAKHRKLGRQAVKREAVYRRMMNGWTAEQIALDMMITMKAVQSSIQRICIQERVKDRLELAAKLGWVHEQPLNGREKARALAREREKFVEPMILEGLSYEQMCQKTGMILQNVMAAVRRVYRRHGLKPGDGRKGLAQKLGVELGGKYAVNDQIERRLKAGETSAQIARTMGLARLLVQNRCAQVYRREGVKGRRALMEKMATARIEMTSQTPILR